MTEEMLGRWERLERTHQGSWLVRVVSGKIIIQCPGSSSGSYMKPGEASYYLAPNTTVLIIAVIPSTIEWKAGYMYGFGGSVSRQLKGGDVE